MFDFGALELILRGGSTALLAFVIVGLWKIDRRLVAIETRLNVQPKE